MTSLHRIVKVLGGQSEPFAAVARVVAGALIRLRRRPCIERLHGFGFVRKGRHLLVEGTHRPGVGRSPARPACGLRHGSREIVDPACVRPEVYIKQKLGTISTNGSVRCCGT